MILIKTLTIKDFLSHENTTIDFKENEKFLLDGKSGSGKSSITDAILWCLFGKGRSDNRSLIRRGRKSATVITKFMGDGDGSKETVITRSISSTGKNTLTVTQNTGTKGQFLPIMQVGTKEIQAWIEKEFLRSSYELFTNSIAYPQENENSFVKTTANRRKELLLELIQAGNFDDLYTKARNAITQLDQENAISLTKIEMGDVRIKELKDVIAKAEKHKKVHDQITKEFNDLVSKEDELEKQISNISVISNQILDKKHVIKLFKDANISIENEMARLNTEIEDHNKIDIKKAEEDVKIAETIKLDIEKIEEELKKSSIAQQFINAHWSNKPQVLDYQSEIEEINKRLIPLLGESDRCPAGDQCPFVKPIKGQIEFLTTQIQEKESKERDSLLAFKKWEKELQELPPTKDVTELYKELKGAKEVMDNLNKSKDIIEKWNNFSVRFGEITERYDKLTIDLADNKRGIDSNEVELMVLESNYNKFNSNETNKELSTIKIKKAEIKKMLDDGAYLIRMGESATLSLKDALEASESLKTDIKKAVEDKESLELVKEAFSPRGIKAVVIDYVVPQLEGRINNVLSQMSDFKIRLDTQKPTADEEGVKEGLFITVINDRQEELPFASYSGGEKVKITVAISEALASLVGQIGFRIMDENIVSLDSESTEGFVDVLEKLQDKFPQLMVISHLPEVKDIFEKKITIIKTNGISKIYE